jgi:hypothetical protein
MWPKLESLNDTEYLGDGAYIGHDGYQIWLLAHDGIEATAAVALEPDTWTNLKAYLTKIETKYGVSR